MFVVSPHHIHTFDIILDHPHVIQLIWLVSNQGMVAQKEWRNRWEGQLSELKRRSMNKDAAAAAGANMSWGARMRMQRNQAASADL